MPCGQRSRRLVRTRWSVGSGRIGSDDPCGDRAGRIRPARMDTSRRGPAGHRCGAVTARGGRCRSDHAGGSAALDIRSGKHAGTEISGASRRSSGQPCRLSACRGATRRPMAKADGVSGESIWRDVLPMPPITRWRLYTAASSSLRMNVTCAGLRTPAAWLFCATGRHECRRDIVAGLFSRAFEHRRGRFERVVPTQVRVLASKVSRTRGVIPGAFAEVGGRHCDTPTAATTGE